MIDPPRQILYPPCSKTPPYRIAAKLKYIRRAENFGGYRARARWGVTHLRSALKLSAKIKIRLGGRTILGAIEIGRASCRERV